MENISRYMVTCVVTFIYRCASASPFIFVNKEMDNFQQNVLVVTLNSFCGLGMSGQN